MPQIQSIYNGNFVVWQRKLAEVVIDLKSDIVNLQKFGLIIAESSFFNSTVERGIFAIIETASHASPNIWNPMHASLLNEAPWVADMNNIAPPENGAWVENSYVFDNGSPMVCRYVRFRIVADAAQNPLQTLALKKVVLTDSADVSLSGGASVQVNVLGWQTGKVLKDILEDILETRMLSTTVEDEISNARISPKGTWDINAENYIAPIPRIFTTLKHRLDDLELDAERRLTGRKLVVPVDDTLAGVITQYEFETNVQADAPYRKILEYVDAKDTVEILIQAEAGVGDFEEPLRTVDGVLVYGKITYGVNSTGYTAGDNAKVTIYRSDTDATYPLPANRTIKFIIPVETDLWHMNKYDLTRGQFSTAVIQDIGVLNEIDTIKTELSDAISSDSVTQELVVFQQSGSNYADLVFPSNATNTSGWVVLKETYGVIVYQEQVMKIAGVLANYSMSEADDLRKAMGKKIASILADHRERFVQGASDNGIAANKETNIFNLIEKFGGYGFNKSHSAAYALIAFQTAFLKAHFAIEFMAALLSSEINSTDGIVKYISDCRTQGITIQPPDIMESDRAFAVIKDEIRFGLAAVKNVGEGAIESIIKARQEKPFTSLFDFCERADLKKVNKRVVESMINCGAFDSTGEYRSRMAAALEDALDYGQRIQKEKNDPQIGLFDMGGGPAINAPTMPALDEWDEAERLTLEKEMLGFYITGHPLDGYEALLEKYTNADTVSLKEKADGEAVRIGGIIRTIKTIKTKKGELMAFVTIEDMLGALELVVFPSVYAKVDQLLADDHPVLVEGAVQKDENSATLLCDTMIPIDKAEETWTASICFNLDLNRLTKEDLPQLKALLEKHAGACRAYLHLRNPEKTETIIALPEEIKLKPGLALTREVNALIGYNAVETLCSPVKVTSGNGKYKSYRKGNSPNA